MPRWIPNCLKGKEPPTRGQVNPDASPEGWSVILVDDTSNSSKGARTPKTAKAPDPREQALTEAIESLEAERGLVVSTQALLQQEQERGRQLSEQLAVATRELRHTQGSHRQALERLDEVTEQKRQVDERLRTLNVLRLGDRREMEELTADRDRYKDIVEDMTSRRLLAGGTNIQAGFPTLLELEADVRRTLTVSVSEWIEDAAPVLHPGINVQGLLTQLFRACQDVVERHHSRIEDFFAGGRRAGLAPEESDEADLNEATASFKLQHMRRHHRTLFPVTGVPFHRACRWVLLRLAGGMEPEAGVRHLLAVGVGKLVEQYLLIMVGALLQHPAVEFGRDCGELGLFDPQIHAESIDGDDVGAGDDCVVVFPALVKEGEEGEEFQPVNKKYILPPLVA